MYGTFVNQYFPGLPASGTHCILKIISKRFMRLSVIYGNAHFVSLYEDKSPFNNSTWKFDIHNSLRRSLYPILMKSAKECGPILNSLWYGVHAYPENDMIFKFAEKVCRTITYATGSLWCRQSQQSFNTLTPFYFLSHLLRVSAPTGHLQVRYTIRYFKDCFKYNESIARTHLM
jgi:hypothetical protein